MSERLYTILFERIDGRETYVEQISGFQQSIDDFADHWSKLFIKKGLISEEDSKCLLEELTYSKELVRIVQLSNAWSCSFLLSTRLYFLNVVQTDITPTKLTAFKPALLSSTQAEKTYERYKKEYILLKDCDIRDRKMNAARQRAEKWMRYWAVKAEFLSHYNTLNKDNNLQSLYTFFFEYGGGTYRDQLWLPDNYLNLMLVAWVETILKVVGGLKKPKKVIDNDKDRILLMERALDECYYPQPISGLVNVWGTYFNLSKGLGDLTIVKTCPPLGVV